MTESAITYQNALYLGYDPMRFFIAAGEKIATILLEMYPSSTRFHILAGTSGNGADALAAAYYLVEQGATKVSVSLFARSSSIQHPVTNKIWEVVHADTRITTQQDVPADSFLLGEVFLEGLVGTGKTGDTLHKKYLTIIKSISHKPADIIAIDCPSGHYSPHKIISLNYPKVANATVIELEYPEAIKNFCGPGEYEALWKPNTHTHIKKNPRILCISESSDQIKKIQQVHDYHVEKVDIEPQDLMHVSSDFFETFDAVLWHNIPDSFGNNASIDAYLNNYADKPTVLSGTSVTPTVSSLRLDALYNALFVVSKKSTSPINDFGGSVIPKNIIVAELGTHVQLVGPEKQKKHVQNNYGVDTQALANFALRSTAFAAKNPLWLSTRAATFLDYTKSSE